MNSRERMRTIVSLKTPDRCGFWLGMPKPETLDIYHKYFGTKTEEELRVKLGDDFRWIGAWGYKDPQGKGLWHIPNKTSHGSAGPLADIEDAKDIEKAYDWPKVDYIDFGATIEALKNAGPYYRASGYWTSFYHNVMDLFGMEQYMMNMLQNPAVVHAVTDKVCQFYFDANERLFAEVGTLADAYFFGNDFGTQLNLICGPKQFDEFIMPWFRKFTEQGHRHGYQVILHSCGSIYRVIERLIEAKVDCLHPLQAKAANMDAETLAREFKGKIAFLGGIDTQDLLVNGTPKQVRADVRRVKKLLSPHLIVSPSHEAILPNVPPENIAAMAEAVLEP
jgi:uroporphyrinogen decarboxylase